jgi:hypothetical protein
VNDLGIGRFFLPIRTREVLRSHQPAVESMGAAIFAVANNAIFKEQAAGIHVASRIVCLLNGYGAFGGAARDKKRKAGKKKAQAERGSLAFHEAYSDFLLNDFQLELCKRDRALFPHQPFHLKSDNSLKT